MFVWSGDGLGLLTTLLFDLTLSLNTKLDLAKEVLGLCRGHGIADYSIVHLSDFALGFVPGRYAILVVWG